MPLDYSKWDAIELSDDEDFECHPNVDKKSMIRWKQAQIHKERQERKDQKDLLTMEKEINKLEEFKERNNAEILASLEALAKEVDAKFTDQIRQESMKRINAWPRNWEPPVWSDVLKGHTPWNEAISEVGKVLEDSIKKDASVDLFPLLELEFSKLVQKYQDRQPIISKEIHNLDNLMNKKLTMDHLVDGFNKTFVNPANDEVSTALSSESKPIKKTIIETIHTPLNQSLLPKEAQEEIFLEMESSDEHLLQLNANLLKYSQTSDYGLLVKILKADPSLLNEKNEETLLLRALCFEVCSRSKEARNCVMVSLILKFVRNLGVSGIDLFFSKLSGTGASAQNLFFSDLNTTFQHIQKRGKVLLQEKLEKVENENQQLEKRKEIYESFLQPDGSLKLPLGPEPTEMELKQAKWFDNLPEYYKQGLLTEDVDKINQYLSSLEPEEAEHQANLAVKAGFINFQEEDE